MHALLWLLAGLAPLPQDAKAPEPLYLGTGAHRYRWVDRWGELPGEVPLGSTHGCVLTDSKGRVYINTETESAVQVFAPDGTRIASWGKELAGGLHGMCMTHSGGEERLWLAHSGRGEVLEVTLEGKVLRTLGWPEASGHYQKAAEYKPTSVALRPGGGVFVADGYGKSWIHLYDEAGKYKCSFGGPGTEPGKLQTPHGILIDARGKEPVLLVADRQNGRLQTFDMDGRFLKVVAEGLKLPCHMALHGDTLLVPELAGGIVLLDKEHKLIARLGENSEPARRGNFGVPREHWVRGEFTAPHCAGFDADGNIYVLDWNVLGRVTKLERAK